MRHVVLFYSSSSFQSVLMVPRCLIHKQLLQNWFLVQGLDQNLFGSALQSVVLVPRRLINTRLYHNEFGPALIKPVVLVLVLALSCCVFVHKMALQCAAAMWLQKSSQEARVPQGGGGAWPRPLRVVWGPAPSAKRPQPTVGTASSAQFAQVLWPPLPAARLYHRGKIRATRDLVGPRCSDSTKGADTNASSQAAPLAQPPSCSTSRSSRASRATLTRSKLIGWRGCGRRSKETPADRWDTHASLAVMSPSQVTRWGRGHIVTSGWLLSD